MSTRAHTFSSVERATPYDGDFVEATAPPIQELELDNEEYDPPHRDSPPPTVLMQEDLYRWMGYSNLTPSCLDMHVFMCQVGHLFHHVLWAQQGLQHEQRQVGCLGS